MSRARFIVVAIAILCAGIVGAGEYPDNILDLNVTDLSIRTDAEGTFVVLDRFNKSIVRWDKEGELIGSCQLTHPSFDNPSKIGNYAINEKLAFIIDLGNNATGIDMTMMGATVVDTATCEVVSTMVIPGPPVIVNPSPEGWVVTTRPYMAHRPGVPHDQPIRMTMYIYDNSGREKGILELPEDVLSRVDSEFPDVIGATAANIITVGNDIWMIPSAYYELWRIGRAGKSDYKIQTPACLNASATIAEDEEAKELLTRRFANSSPETKERANAMLEQMKSNFYAYMGAISATVGHEGRIAVFVTNRKEGGCRLDVWDTTYESVVYVKKMPWDLCPAFIGLSDDYVWTYVGGKILRFEIPPVYEPLKDPCEVIEN